jgi:hypothetical protein
VVKIKGETLATGLNEWYLIYSDSYLYQHVSREDLEYPSEKKTFDDPFQEKYYLSARNSVMFLFGSAFLHSRDFPCAHQKGVRGSVLHDG